MTKTIIVKVQVPMWSSEAEAPALIYNKGKDWLVTMRRDEMPEEVWKAAVGTGKAYFYAELKGRDIVFGKEASRQEW